MSNIAEIKRRADIREVWAALGGGKLRGLRGKAFWRGGAGYSVSLDPEKGVWYDFAAADGGDVVALVQRVLGCDFRAAAVWLGDFCGVPMEKTARTHAHADATGWSADLRWARRWALAAQIMAEKALEEMQPWDLERAGMTALLRAIRLGFS